MSPHVPLSQAAMSRPLRRGGQGLNAFWLRPDGQSFGRPDAGTVWMQLVNLCMTSDSRPMLQAIQSTSGELEGLAARILPATSGAIVNSGCRQ